MSKLINQKCSQCQYRCCISAIFDHRCFNLIFFGYLPISHRMPENFSNFSVTTRDENSFPFTCVTKTQALASEEILRRDIAVFVINLIMVHLIFFSIWNKFYFWLECVSMYWIFFLNLTLFNPSCISPPELCKPAWPHTTSVSYFEIHFPTLPNYCFA